MKPKKQRKVARARRGKTTAANPIARHNADEDVLPGVFCQVRPVPKGKTVSISLAQADFGAVVKLARRFDFVRVMSAGRLVGVFTSAKRWQKSGWLAEIEPLSNRELEQIYARRTVEDEEWMELERAYAARLRPRSRKPAKRKSTK
jgi:hypothetical protein